MPRKVAERLVRTPLHHSLGILRGIGACCSPALELRESADAPRRLALAALPDVLLPADFPVAAVPRSAAVSASNVCDTDLTGLLLSPQEAEGDELALAHFFSMLPLLGARSVHPMVPWIEAQLDAIGAAPPPAAEWRAECVAAYEHLAQRAAMPPPAVFERACRYVSFALQELVPPADENAAPLPPGEDSPKQPPAESVVCPLLDAVSNRVVGRRAAGGNIGLRAATAAQIRDLCREFELRGGQQFLARRDKDAQFLLLVTLRDIHGGEELALQGACWTADELESDDQRFRCGL